MYSDEETVNLLKTNKTKHSRMLWLSYHSLIPFLEINHSRRSKYNRTGVPDQGDARGLKVVLTWVHLYQWGDAFDVRGDADTKRLGTPAIGD